jgi:RNA polymerase sigma-70 factor, ECF subfamily
MYDGDAASDRRLKEGLATARPPVEFPVVQIESTPAKLQKTGFEAEALPWLDAVYRFALRLAGGRESEAEDITQETFLRAYRSWDTFEPGTNARSWLFTICRNVFLRQQQLRARVPETANADLDADLEALAAIDVFHDTAFDPEHRFFDTLVDEEVTRALDALPSEFREAVALSDVEGMGYNEIAAVLGIPKGTVKSRIFRGRRLLQQTLRAYAQEMGYIRRPRA